jgi:transposase
MEVYRNMQQWADIRRRVLQEGVSKRQILRETGLHWTTLEKILAHSQPPGYRLREFRQKGKLGPYVDAIRQIIAQDKLIPKKQRHTAKRIFERLRADGYSGGYTVVKDAVQEIKRTSGEVYMPLVHRPGDAQVDYFHALARLGGTLQKVAIFLMALPYSDGFFMMCVPRECTESFWEGHARAFEFFGGVPDRISYDNQQDRRAGDHRRARPQADRRVPAVGQPLPVQLPLLHGAARQRKGRGRRHRRLRTAQLPGPRAPDGRLRRAERPPAGVLPERPSAPPQGPAGGQG